jgi:hypothetical protein
MEEEYDPPMIPISPYTSLLCAYFQVQYTVMAWKLEKRIVEVEAYLLALAKNTLESSSYISPSYRKKNTIVPVRLVEIRTPPQ